MDFRSAIRTQGSRIRPALRNTREALSFIDQELPAELSALSCWTFARDLLVEAERTGKKRDLRAAVRQLKQALDNEGWLAERGQSRAVQVEAR
jgi:hypothetical protein